MRASVPVVVLSVLLALPAPAALANTTAARVYFQCADTPVANADREPAAWAPAPPTETFASGGGCAYGDIAGYNGSAGPAAVESARFAGTYTGTLSGLNVRLDTIPAGTAQAASKVQFDLTLTVDGRNPFGGPRRVSLQPIVASSGRFHSYYFSIVGLPYTSSAEARLHHISLTAETVDQAAVAWVYGAKEVPAGINFNPEGTHPAVLTP